MTKTLSLSSQQNTFLLGGFKMSEVVKCEMTASDYKYLCDLLVALRNSCYEGEDGTWDCTTDEGRESFIPMAESCETIARLLKVEMPEYESDQDEEDDQDD